MESRKNSTEIRPIPEPILEAASNGKLVVFIGAGVSRLLGCPSWQELAQKYLKYLYDQQYVSYVEYEYLKKLDPRKLLSICKNFLRKKNLSEPSMKDFLEADKEKYEKFSKIYDLIYSWNVVFITTNFDEYLDEAVNKLKPPTINISTSTSDPNSYPSPNKGKIISDPDRISIAQLYIPGTVIHFHGNLKSKRRIITITDYLYHYKQDKIQEFLSKLFEKFTVLFIGYGLEEYELLEFLIYKSQINTSPNSELKKKEIKHYMLYPLFSWEKKMLEFLQSYYEDLNIKLITYEIDRKGYEILYDIIKNWTPQIKETAQSPRVSNILELIDEVIE